MIILFTIFLFTCVLNLADLLLDPRKESLVLQTQKYKLLDYKPIRIHVHYHKLDQQLSEIEIAVLNQSFDIVINYLSQILAVSPLNRSLLLKRNACQRSWLDGPNKGKCAYKIRNYIGEFCKGGFKIPDEHLEGFQVWRYNASEPRTWFQSGDGVNNADYILYVQAFTTNECVLANYRPSGKALVAYSADCGTGNYAKTDENGRPVAGYMNFCPSKLKEIEKHKEKLILTIIHETIHTLGFSKDYFFQFKDCSTTKLGSECPPQRFPMYRKIGNYTRFLTSNVVRQMQKQFSCNQVDFGGPMDMKKHKNHDFYILQSHWDRKLMYGSIMAPSFGPPELTFVDSISLALLEDSGWYKVNYSNVDDYPWGKGKGCNYPSSEGLNIGTCIFDNKMIDNGCNVFHTHKVACAGTNTLDVDVLESNSCSQEVSGIDDSSEKNDSLFSRCLLSNISSQSVNTDVAAEHLKGTCFKVKCLELEKIEVNINDSLKVLCSADSIVTLEKMGLSGIIVCPSELGLVCFQKSAPLYLKIQPRNPTFSGTKGLEEVTEFFGILQTKETRLRNAMTSKGCSLASLERLCQKIFCTIIFCLIVLYLKMNGRVLFCMF